MESELTCILCKQKIPAKEHKHNCEDGITVQIVNANLPNELPEHLKLNINNPKNAFSIRAERILTQKCDSCKLNEVKSFERIWKICSDASDGIDGRYRANFEKCNECQEKEENDAAKTLREDEKRLLRKKEVDHEWLGSHNLQCRFCGQVFILTKEDFNEHEEFCQRNSQLEN